MSADVAAETAVAGADWDAKSMIVDLHKTLNVIIFLNTSVNNFYHFERMFLHILQNYFTQLIRILTSDFVSFNDKVKLRIWVRFFFIGFVFNLNIFNFKMSRICWKKLCILCSKLIKIVKPCKSAFVLKQRRICMVLLFAP